MWLIVSPGNPLKQSRGMAPLAQRLASARRIADGRRVVASAIEAVFGTRYTIDTLRLLLLRFPRVRFVWLMGADNPRAVAALAGLAGLRPPHSFRRAAAAGLQSPCLGEPCGASIRARPAAGAIGAVTVPPSGACLGVSVRAAECRVGHCDPCKRRSLAIAKPSKPQSPARHRAAPRKKVAKPTLAVADKTPGTPRKKTIAAGPRAPAARRTRKTEPSVLERLQTVIVGSLEDDKAENIVTLDLAGRASFCDRMVIATGLADRQITAMAEHLAEKLHAAGLKRVQVEGAGGADWVLIDAGDIVVHLFKPEARAMYPAGEDVGRRTRRGRLERHPRRRIVGRTASLAAITSDKADPEPRFVGAAGVKPRAATAAGGPGLRPAAPTQAQSASDDTQPSDNDG